MTDAFDDDPALVPPVALGEAARVGAARASALAAGSAANPGARHTPARVYYNEFDPYAAAWLRNLIAAGELPAGDVDERDIKDVSTDDIRGYAQAHFFAGLGGWPYALALAGWGSEPVWSGSCPCQPLSSAGQRKGHADERHLWPAFHRLIAECRPATVFGEQVASPDGREWLAAVRADLEDDGYAVGAADLCAASAGAPHERQRLFWVADVNGGNAGSEGLQRGGEHRFIAKDRGAPRGLDFASGVGRQWGEGSAARGERDGQDAGRAQDEHGAFGADEGSARGLDFPPGGGRTRLGHQPAHGEPLQASALSGFWRDADWLYCTDGKWRPVEPGAFPLGHGLPARMGRLRAYGNAIVPWVAKEFIEAHRDIAAARRDERPGEAPAATAPHE